jgi:pectate lyase
MSGNRISDMTSLGSLPASGARVPVVKNGIQTNYSYDIAAKMASLDANDAALAAADVAFTAADAALAAADAARPTSAALAATSGAGLMGLADGSLLSSTALKARRLFYGTKSRDTSLRSARLTADAIHTIIQGYAKTAGGGAAITGGYGKQLFIVKHRRNGPDCRHPTAAELVNALPVGEGSYAWCLAQAAVAGGMIVFDPRGHFDLKIRDNVQHRIDIGMNDITVIAPGRNVTFWHKSLTGSTVIKGHNLIFAYIEFAIMPGPRSGDYDGSGNKVEVGLVSVFPQNIDKLAFVGCSCIGASDGALDIASTGFTTASSAAYVTIQDHLFRDVDEVSLLGSISDTTTVTDTRKLFVTVSNPTYDGCGQRLPKALGLAMVDVVNPHHQMLPWRRDEPSPGFGIRLMPRRLGPERRMGVRSGRTVHCG